MRKVVKSVIDILIRYDIQIPQKKMFLVETGIEFYGEYGDIEKTINALVNASDEKQRAEAIKMAYNLQNRLGTKE